MTDTTIIAVATSITTVITAGMATWLKYAISDVHKVVNSRMDEMLAIAKSASKAEGVIEGERTRALAVPMVAVVPTTPLTEARLIEILDAREGRKSREPQKT